MASDIQNEMESKYPVSQWSRMTVADGNALNKKTIKPLIERDDFLADKISEFADLIDIESEQRKLNDTAISAALDKEIKDRKDQFDAIEEEFSSEASEREAADEELQEQIDNHIKLRASVETDVSGHVTYEEYTNFNNTYNTVHTYSGDWDNVSAINVGTGETATKLTDSEVTMVGNNHVSVTSNGSTITVASTGSVGSVSEPIYMKEDGTFDKCTNATAGKFGNAVISIQGDQAYAEYFVNNNTKKGITDRPTSTPYIDYTATGDMHVFTPPKLLTNSMLDKCIQAGVNNFIIRYDSYNTKSVTNNQIAENNIVDLSIDVQKLEKYKMYTINLVPLYVDGLPSNTECSWNDEIAGRLQYSISFLNSSNKYINFSNADYKCYTYGYLYNVPAFGTNYRDAWSGTFINDTDKKEHFRYCNINTSDNAVMLAQKWQVHANDSTYYDTMYDKQYTDVSMMTIQPHSEVSLYTRDVKDLNGDNYDGLSFENIGENKIAAIMMERVNSTPDSNTYTGKVNVFRRQLSFMRGDDIDTVESSVVETIPDHELEGYKTDPRNELDFFIAFLHPRDNSHVQTAGGIEVFPGVTQAPLGTTPGGTDEEGDKNVYIFDNDSYFGTRSFSELQKYINTHLKNSSVLSWNVPNETNWHTYLCENKLKSIIANYYKTTSNNVTYTDYEKVYFGYKPGDDGSIYGYFTQSQLDAHPTEYTSISLKGIHIKSMSVKIPTNVKNVFDTKTITTDINQVAYQYTHSTQQFYFNIVNGYLRIVTGSGTSETLPTEKDFKELSYGTDIKIIKYLNTHNDVGNAVPQGDYNPAIFIQQVMQAVLKKVIASNSNLEGTINVTTEIDKTGGAKISNNKVKYSLTINTKKQTGLEAYTLYFFSQATY